MQLLVHRLTLRERIHTASISLAPENNWSALIFWCAENIVKLDSEAIQVSNVQGSKVVVESVVEKSIVNTEVARGVLFALRHRLWAINCSG
jgi:hypothetical protein